eukprot:763061-Hanusia_phi.AAC.7
MSLCSKRLLSYIILTSVTLLRTGSLAQLLFEGIANNTAVVDANIDVYLRICGQNDGAYRVQIMIDGHVFVDGGVHVKNSQENYVSFNLPDLYEGTYTMEASVHGPNVKLNKIIIFHVWNTFFDSDFIDVTPDTTQETPSGALIDSVYEIKTYSSITCTGGVQDDGYAPDEIGQRVCRFSHLCWARDQDDLENVKAWSPYVIHGSIPTWFRTLDTTMKSVELSRKVVTIMQAADAFSMDRFNEAQVLLLSKCRLPGSLDGIPRARNCRKNYNELMRVFFPRPVLHLDVSSAFSSCWMKRGRKSLPPMASASAT